MRHVAVLGIAALTVLAAFSTAVAQVDRDAESGFSIELDASASGRELTRQPSLWVMDLSFKPMRLVAVEITNPRTKKKELTLVWYTIYRAVNRKLEKRSEIARDVTPVNELDLPPGPPLFTPEFTLITTDNGRVRVYEDEVIPEAQVVIEKREGKKYPNSVQVIQPVPDAESGSVIEGVVTFRGIESDTDFFTVIAEGFSNGYQITKGPDGDPLMWRKAISVKYWRPGDEFFEREKEFRLKGRPEWFYRPREVQDDPLAGVPAEAAESDPEANR